MELTSVEICTGAGGQALGLEQALLVALDTAEHKVGHDRLVQIRHSGMMG